MSNVYALAAKSAEAKLRYEALGCMNVFNETSEQRVARDARHRIARDAWLAAEAEYQKALRHMSAEELRKATEVRV